MTHPDDDPDLGPVQVRPQPLGPTQRGMTWAWICREIAAGRLPPGTTPDTLPDHMRPAEPES